MTVKYSQYGSKTSSDDFAKRFSEIKQLQACDQKMIKILYLQVVKCLRNQTTNHERIIAHTFDGLNILLRCVYTSGFRALQASKRLLVLLWLWKRDVRRFERFSCVTGSMENGSHAALHARCERRKLWWAWCPGRFRPVSACISSLIKDTFRVKWSVVVVWNIYA